jgi:hypothetical protein
MVQQSRFLPVPVPPDKNVLTGYDCAFEDSCEFVGDGANADQVFDPKVLCIELADGKRDAVQATGRHDSGNPATIR